MTETLRLATRGSDLALRQAETVREALSSRRRDVELRQVETRGDQIPDELIHRLGKTGAFVRALDEEVLAGDADLAVHSLKDLPTEDMADLVVAGVPERAPSGDVVVQRIHPEQVGYGDVRLHLSAFPRCVSTEPGRGKHLDSELDRIEKRLRSAFVHPHACLVALCGQQYRRG
jgi:hypothetical protein